MKGRNSEIGKELSLALRWWLQTLEFGICEVYFLSLPMHSWKSGRYCTCMQVRPWRQIVNKPVHLLCDARCLCLTLEYRSIVVHFRAASFSGRHRLEWQLF